MYGQNFNGQQWTTFFQIYQQMILHYVPLLIEHDVDIYCVSTELITAVTTQPTGFISVIAAAKSAGYKGKFVIGFNRELNIDPRLYAQLDYIGEDAYYQLKSTKAVLLSVTFFALIDIHCLQFDLIFVSGFQNRFVFSTYKFP